MFVKYSSWDDPGSMKAAVNKHSSVMIVNMMTTSISAQCICVSMKTQNRATRAMVRIELNARLPQ